MIENTLPSAYMSRYCRAYSYEFSLAPNVIRMGRSAQHTTTVSTAAIATNITAAHDKIFFALSSSPSPSAIEKMGAPPVPTKKANDDINVVIGAQTPTPASAISPMTSMLPTKMRSTME